MSEILTKLRPDRDLQCYFQQPSAVAALNETGAAGFTVSGCWRQQFDWAVLEWNRDNVFEHPALRNLPDGDLSGVRLSYREARTNCIPLDSNLFPTVDWPYLRVWSDSPSGELISKVPIKNYASPAAGAYTAATVEFELQGAATSLDYIELAWLDQHFNYQLLGVDTLESAAAGLAAAITANSATGRVTATASGTTITLTYIGTLGTNGNRIGVYGTVHGAGTESWSPASATFSGGQSPDSWQVALDFSNLTDVNGATVPTTNVRKLRWTWAADLQPESYSRSEFSVAVSDWAVTGTNLQYAIAGPGSRRIEDDSSAVTYHGTWPSARGNFSGGSIHWTTTPGASLDIAYIAAASHSLYLGTRCADGGGQVSIQVDGSAPVTIGVAIPLEDVLTRVPLGQFSGGVQHTVRVTHTGSDGSYFYFDFLEIALPASVLPTFAAIPGSTLATDWDTLHSQAIAPERTAWLIKTLGFQGRANHYAGALWFYELYQPGQQYASGTITFSGAPEFGNTSGIFLGPTPISHLNLIGDTPESIATCFALLINAGSTGVWAKAAGNVLTITARTMGSAGNSIAIAASTNSSVFTAGASAATLTGGTDGVPEGDAGVIWRTDLTATPRLNRAARDWSRSFFQALQGYGIAVTAAFSMEIGNGDDTLTTGIAQRYPDGTAAWLNTPALQTNFGLQSTAFWKQVYLDMAAVMVEAGVDPYVQFGEVQWWYFAAPSGMPFYDAYTTSLFQSTYGQPISVVTSQNADPAPLAKECAFLPGLIGAFTDAVIDFVRQSHPLAKFEVLYPVDVNDTPLNRIINYPTASWTASRLACLKTENFTFTGGRNLDEARKSIQYPAQAGFPPAQASHLVGISDYTTPWARERRLAMGAGVESVVLFALDQFCLIGYSLPLDQGPRRVGFMGA